MDNLRKATYWDDAADAAVEAIFANTTGLKDLNTERKVIQLRNDLDRFIDRAFEQDIATSDEVMASWAGLGAAAIEISNLRRKPLLFTEVTSTLVRKQRDYGHENIRRFGRRGLLVRAHDKVARLENLMGKKAKSNFESIDDTLLDIVGYSAIGMLWEQDLFLLELRPMT
jgi:hypothetical protein